MATPHGSDSFLSVDGLDISGYVDSTSVVRNQDTSQTTAFGDDDHTFIAGLKHGTFSLGGHWDPAANTNQVGCFDGAVVELIYGPEGDTASQVSYTASCFITDYSVDSSVTDKVSWSASFQRSGPLTDGTF